MGVYREFHSSIPDKAYDPDGIVAGMGVKDLTLVCHPTLSFANCAIFKGCLHRSYLQAFDGEAFVIMWRNNEKNQRFYPF